MQGGSPAELLRDLLPDGGVRLGVIVAVSRGEYQPLAVAAAHSTLVAMAQPAAGMPLTRQNEMAA